MAHRDRVLVADGHAFQPRRVGRGYPSSDHLGDMPVDVITEQGGGVFSDLAQLTIRQESGLHKGLEAVAYSENQSAS